ncbi:polysaccharide biosynthesis tyrosine autokinase [Amnibacterium kyonggiense]|uniref:polysaccharide biosynthesis tyrosine autokinase n=1 Tax=Amnibacterium kyonggiense TaxID=595671 RepID=UPI001FE2B296|nr:polysaccharide biosynthesis tyrosine autokinase [Amnibacterium kyonggiense]
MSVLRRNFLVVTATFLASICVGFGYLLVVRPTYTATAQSFVSISSAANVSDLAQGNVYLQQIVRSYANVADSPLVLNEVRSELGLKEPVGKLQSAVQASVPLNTVILTISANQASPTEAAALANKVSDVLAAKVVSLTGDDQNSQAPVKISVIERATPPTEASSPKGALVLGLSAFIGLALGAILSIARATIDTKIRSIGQLTSISTAPLLGSILFDRTLRAQRAIVPSPSSSPVAESIKNLRTNLRYVDIEHSNKSIVVTSSVPSEGKSFTAVNLAIAFAAAGQRTLLVDADLRRPSVAAYLGLDGSVGLTDLLAQESELSNLLQEWGQLGLHVLPAGETPPNPSELLESERMRELMSQFARVYDVVIYDVPPLLAVTDAAIIAANASGAILIAGFGQVRTQQVRASLAHLEVVRARLLGVVATMVPPTNNEYGYAYYGYEAEHRAAISPAPEPA